MSPFILNLYEISRKARKGKARKGARSRRGVIIYFKAHQERGAAAPLREIKNFMQAECHRLS